MGMCCSFDLGPLLVQPRLLKREKSMRIRIVFAPVIVGYAGIASSSLTVVTTVDIS
jgi:hypothetical protein